jgi:hypothetical protein
MSGHDRKLFLYNYQFDSFKCQSSNARSVDVCDQNSLCSIFSRKIYTKILKIELFKVGTIYFARDCTNLFEFFIFKSNKSYLTMLMQCQK